MIDNNKYELVVGLEVHAQLMTKSKLFCSDNTDFGASPNTQVSPVSLAHPGTLPVMNKAAIELAVKLGIALHCDIEHYNYFARKNYFYPDLPKGYQISQHTAPICKNGYVKIQTQLGSNQIQLNRIHIEEDAGKSIHDLDENYTCIDLNRAGVPLVEIVTEPVIHSSEEAFSFLTELRKTLRWLEVCDGNMEEGSMRCDANISIRIKGDKKLGNRVEVKNLNSIRNVKRAIDIEFERLIKISEDNKEIIQETRSYDADKNITFSLRSKEDAEDYRYFPEPDLPPFVIDERYISQIKESLPELPESVILKFQEKYHLSEYDAMSICNEKEDVFYFEKLVEQTSHYKAVANWMLGPLKYYCNENDISLNEFPLSINQICELIDLVETNQVSFSNASGKVLGHLLNNPDSKPKEAANTLGLIQENNEDQILQWVEEVISEMPEKVKEYKSGKKGLIGMFAGEVKKKSKGAADMQQVNHLLTQKLNS